MTTLAAPEARHRVEFEVDWKPADDWVYLRFVTRVTCVSAEGATCLLGCPVEDCDWDHDPDGCPCCVGACDCGRCDITRRIHAFVGCPHRFQRRGCWVAPWAYFSDPSSWVDRQLLGAAKQLCYETVNTTALFAVVYRNWDSDGDDGWKLTEADLTTLCRRERADQTNKGEQP